MASGTCARGGNQRLSPIARTLCDVSGFDEIPAQYVTCIGVIIYNEILYGIRLATPLGLSSASEKVQSQRVSLSSINRRRRRFAGPPAHRS